MTGWALIIVWLTTSPPQVMTYVEYPDIIQCERAAYQLSAGQRTLRGFAYGCLPYERKAGQQAEEEGVEF